MAQFVVAHLVSTLALLAAIFAVISLIVRRRRIQGQAVTVPRYKLVGDIFGQGVISILQCRWVLLLPLLTLVVESLIPLTRAFVAPSGEQLPTPGVRVFLSPLGMVRPSLEPAAVVGDLIENLGYLNTAMLFPFDDPLAAGIILLGFAYLLLFQYPFASGDSETKPKRKTRQLLGLASGVAGCLFLAFYAFVTANRMLLREYPSWVYPRVLLIIFPLVVFVNAVLLQMMASAAEDKRLSFMEAIFKGKERYWALFYLSLLRGGIWVVGSLPFLAMPRHIGSSVLGLPSSLFFVLSDLNRLLVSISLGIISFLGVIIVVRKATLVAAFDDCITLWARHPRACALLLFDSALLLLLPKVLGEWAMAEAYGKEWTTHASILLASSLEIVAGVLIMSSMTVFYLRHSEAASY